MLLLLLILVKSSFPPNSELRSLVYGLTQDGITDGQIRYHFLLEKFVAWLTQQPWPYKDLDKLENRCTRGYINGPGAHHKSIRPRWDTFQVRIEDGGGAIRMTAIADISANVPTYLKVGVPMPFNLCEWNDAVCDMDVFVTATVSINVLFTVVLDPGTRFAHIQTSGGGRVGSDYTVCCCEFHRWWRSFVSDFQSLVDDAVQSANANMAAYLQETLVFNRQDYDLTHNIRAHYEIETVTSAAQSYLLVQPNVVFSLGSSFIYRDEMADRANLRPPLDFPLVPPRSFLTHFLRAGVAISAALWSLAQDSGLSNLNGICGLFLFMLTDVQ